MKTIKRFIASAGTLLMSGILILIFKNNQGKCFPWYRDLSKKIMAWIGNITKIVPIAIWDFLEVMLILILVSSFIKMIVKHKSFIEWVSKVVRTISLLFFIVVVIWMLNHYAPPLANELKLDKTLYTQEELYEAAEYYTAKAAEYAPLMARDENEELKQMDFYELAGIAGKSYSPLKEKYPIFDGAEYPVKKLWLLGDWLMYKGFTGEFMPYTAEASVPQNDATVDIPFTMCHEVAHRLCIASEEEANFSAYMACEASEDIRFRYSGYYSAYVYCYNALTPELRKKLKVKGETEDGYRLLFLDSASAANHYQKYDGKISEMGDEVNDKYLKSFNEESGTKSYGEVVDDLVAWYQSNQK